VRPVGQNRHAEPRLGACAAEVGVAVVEHSYHRRRLI
jgi:hypothetical protein